MSKPAGVVPALVPAACRCGCGRPQQRRDLYHACYEWWRTHGRPDAVPPPGPLRHAGNPVAVQLRDALKVYLWQHMSSCSPQAWLSAYELCRVIAQRYTRDAAGGHWAGRIVTLEACLAELEAAGEVECRETGGRPARQYRWRPAAQAAA